MTVMQAVYEQLGATLAGDGIPLHFGDLKAEYQAALNGAVLLDRSHEGRVELTGQDRQDLMNRISTNDMLNLHQGQGRPTLFTNANARIIDRVVAFNRPDERLLLLAGPGRAAPLQKYLQRNIFFNDKAHVANLTADTYQFALHGPQATAIMAELVPDAKNVAQIQSIEAEIDGVSVFMARLKPLVDAHWVLVMSAQGAQTVWQALMSAREAHGLAPAGGLTYNTLRIRAGRPAMGRELTSDYIPLELGLWDEVSFNKGCYTGQEIIARMESRNKLARTIVRLKLEQMIDAPTELFYEGKRAGMLTSSVTSPEGEVFAMGVIKTGQAEPGIMLQDAQGVNATVEALLGVQPARE